MKHPIWFVLNVAVPVIKWIWAIYQGRLKMSQFEPAVEYVLLREKGIEEQANDPGGVTKYGISFRFLKSVSPECLRLYGIPIYISTDTIRDLTIEQAKALYKGEFWNHAPFERINNQLIANYLFDTCINMGIAPGVKCLQRALWAVRSNRAILVDDGILGEETLKQVNCIDSVLLLAALRSERGGEYRLIADRKPEEGKQDLDGWLNRSYNHSI